MASFGEDPFDHVLNLEERYYEQGYAQGYEDGFQAGKVEGRSVGLKKGYEKFVEAGRLQGKAVVWANRLAAATATVPEASSSSSLPPLPPAVAPRLRKNVAALYALVEPGTLSTENTDEAVNDFDDRVKRAQGKLRVVERAVGEETDRPSAAAATEAPVLGRNEI